MKGLSGKKKNSGRVQSPSSSVRSDASTLNKFDGVTESGYSVIDADGGVTLKTSEILDFSEGTDSDP
ncbi:hypothetical protein SDC9_43987 [bioreactor metagenome]|uniref:Uncharacterized protein n=1 Tax=bioreactor metagenome TaxID=1076179 RepID=A0A644W520_9ZZZZ